MKKMESFARCKRIIEFFLMLTVVLYLCELGEGNLSMSVLEELPFELKGALLPINMILGMAMLYTYYWTCVCDKQ